MIAALINHLWQSTLFCGGAWLITLALRANSASLRHWIWLLASLKFLVPFSLLFLIGSFIGLPAARIADEQPLMLGDALQSASLLVSPGALRATDDSRRVRIVLVILLSIWLGGALFVARAGCSPGMPANSLARAARPAPGAPADARITDADIEPAVARVFRPVVLLPAALLGRLSEPQMNAVLAHERRTHRAARQSQGKRSPARRDAVLVSPGGVVDRPADARGARARLRRARARRWS